MTIGQSYNHHFLRKFFKIVAASFGKKCPKHPDKQYIEDLFTKFCKVRGPKQVLTIKNCVKTLFPIAACLDQEGLEKSIKVFDKMYGILIGQPFVVGATNMAKLIREDVIPGLESRL